MKATTGLLAALLLSIVSAAQAAPAPYLVIDHSTEILMDQATALSIWKEHRMPEKFGKLYPTSKWGFASQVEGGFDDAKTCIITARAMMLPRSGKALLFKPAQTATTFGTLPGATADQCRALAKTKLSEAIASVRDSLVPR